MTTRTTLIGLSAAAALAVGIGTYAFAQSSEHGSAFMHNRGAGMMQGTSPGLVLSDRTLSIRTRQPENSCDGNGQQNRHPHRAVEQAHHAQEKDQQRQNADADRGAADQRPTQGQRAEPKQIQNCDAQ